MISKSPAVFVDRDDTIMENVDYCSDPKQVRIFPGVPEALRRLKSNGFKLIIITNQSGIGRGFFTNEQYRAVEAEVLRQLGDGLIDACYFCPDVPGQRSNCRKPAPGMIEQAVQRFPQIELAQSYMLGDKASDVGFAKNTGCRSILLKTGYGERVLAGKYQVLENQPDFICQDMPAATAFILKRVLP